MSKEYLLLGILNQESLSGYDLHKQFGGLAEDGWNTEQRQIYYLLHKLEKRRWVTVTVVPQQDKPNKKIYHITEEGRTALHEWVKTPLDREAIPFDWMGQLFLGYEVSTTDIIHILENRQSYLEDKIQVGNTYLVTLENALAADPASPVLRYRLLSLHHGFTYTLSELNWVQEAIGWLKSLHADSITPDQLGAELLASLRQMNESG